MRAPRPMALILAFLTALAFAQQTPPQAEIRTTVPLVLAPVTVMDAKGKPVRGLMESDFQLHDNGKPRPFQMEVTNQPIAVVVCIQTNASSGPALAKLPKVSSLFLPLIAGDGGLAAVITYSESVKIRRDFTRNGNEFAAAFQGLRPEGPAARMLDAVERGLELLEKGSADYRKVLIVIGESRDRGSETPLPAVLTHAARMNVTIYPVTYSTFTTQFTTKGDERFGKEPPPEQEDRRTKVSAPSGGMNPLGGLGELGRLGKPNAAEALAKSTGGVKLSFARLKALESMIQAVGEDLHQHYLISFTPGEGSPGYRSLQVTVKGYPGHTVRTRPGYQLSLAEPRP
ncbi:MAG: VWA domain-containing protein [Acidobacteria bacterium]|nr:VWA domain-containing protein [Acidobacteriota bacterium]